MISVSPSTVESITAQGAPTSTRLLVVLAVLSVLFVAAGVFLLIFWLRLRRQSESDTAILQPTQSIARNRLTSIWDKFLARLPSSVRTTIPTYSHFVVFGNSGAGKSALIGRKVDWQGQASQFIPSFTADPLMQIYLGSKALVQEFSPALQDSTARGANEALKKLWRSLDVEQVPTVVVVMMASSLSSASPDEIRKQAQLLRGKVNVLSESCGGSARVRICLTHMDRVRGYSELARFLCKQRIPLELDLGTDASGDLVAGLVAYERYLPRALTTLSLTTFESMVEFLRSADQVLAPVVSFVQALTEGSVASNRPEVQRVYFSTLSSDEQVSNPFDPQLQRAGKLGSFLTRLLRPLGIRPIHAVLGLALFVLGTVGLSIVTKRHRVYVEDASEASLGFAQAVTRAAVTRNSGESDVVRRAEQRARQALRATKESEDRFRPLRVIYRTDKNASERQFVESIRSGYLLPSLERALRQRASDKILYALVALYATRENTLGAFIKAEPTDWSADVGVPSDTLLEYVQHSITPWTETALVSMPPLISEGRSPITDLAPWRAYVGGIAQAVKRPYLAQEELQLLQREGIKLKESLAQIRRGALLRKLYRTLAEESPLDMIKLFGKDASILRPNPWLTDQEEPLQRVLQMVQDSSIRVEQAATGKSLYQLLHWLNESDAAQKTAATTVLAGHEETVARLLFPGESETVEVNRREWQELLLRSRKRSFSLLSSLQEEAPSPRPFATKRLIGTGKKGKGKGKGRRALFASEGATKSQPPTAQSMPLWSQEEFAPKLASLLTSDDMPSAGLSDIYNRAVYQREVLPLVRELKKALNGNRTLSAQDKISLSRTVQAELSTYARRYCAALLNYHLAYRLQGRSPAALHEELLDLIKPGSPFVSRLRTVVENATLTGLDEPYLRPLADCIAEFQPLVDLLAKPAEVGVKEPLKVEAPNKADLARADKADPARADASKGDKKESAEVKATPAPAGSSDGEGGGLGPYRAAVAKLIAELDGIKKGGPPAAAGGSGDRTSALLPLLSPIGKSALAMHENQDDSSLRKAEQFLDQAGIAGALRRPFLAPFLAVHQTGTSEIERTLAKHWQGVMNSQIAPLFNRFPFNRSAEREIAPAELDVLSEQKGPIFAELRGLYAPALQESAGVYSGRSGVMGGIQLPKDMLPTVNKLARLSRALFGPDGNRQPLQLSIRGQPGPQTISDRQIQPTLAFLQVGKAAAYGFNQQNTAISLAVEWWAQGTSVVGVESVAESSGRKHTQTLEVADSAWSLFRLLQRSTLESTGVSTWRINGDGPDETKSIRFVLSPDPWELFSVQLH